MVCVSAPASDRFGTPAIADPFRWRLRPRMPRSAAGDGSGKSGRNRVEHGRQRLTHGGLGADRGDRDQSSDQAIIDGCSAVFVLRKPGKLCKHDWVLR